MSMLLLLGVVFLAGLAGGMVNALMSDNGFVLPRSVATEAGAILRPGFLGNCLVGGVAAAISWGLYGPLSAVFVLGGPARPAAPVEVGLTLASLAGAVLVGIGGARWLTNEVDKQLLKAAAARAASGDPSERAAQAILAAPPARALELAQGLTTQS